MTELADDRARRRALGTSPEAIRHHYDLSDDFFKLWLGPELVYSCGWWDGPDDDLETAQRRKLDFFADRLGVRGRRVLDVGCGWGAFLARCVEHHGATGGVGVTLSHAQQSYSERRGVPDVQYRLENWVDHEPAEPYDVITAIESTEHFAGDNLTPDEKVEVYRSFFATASTWLRPSGRLGLQLICLDNVGHEGSRPGRGPFTDLILEHIFPDSMSASLSELVLGWETWFELDEFHEHSDHYARTFRAWNLAHRAQAERAADLVGPEQIRTFEQYFAAGEVAFRLREQTLYRAILTRRAEPKSWAVVLTPSGADATAAPPAGTPTGASKAAVREHYDVSNDFYRLWLGPTMMYSSGMYPSDRDQVDLDTAQARKVDSFATRLLPDGAPGARVLDIGCGWGWNLRRLVAAHGIAGGVGLTLSGAQRDFVSADPIAGVDIRPEDWRDHQPRERYDAVFSFGAFEHFAADGTTGPQRVAAYRAFFSSCFDWLVPGGRMALETIAHDGAPDTAAPLGRGPLGDFVLDIFPESVCPHLAEVVLGLEPWFEIEVLRADGADFGRTCRAWLLGLRAHEIEAAALVGEPTVRRFARYLAASEVQFRTRVVTNYRLVLRRRVERRR